MNIGKAYAIFRQLDSKEYTLKEKGFAIHQVLDLATHNGITKVELLNALRWLWNLCFEIEQRANFTVIDGGKGKGAEKE